MMQDYFSQSSSQIQQIEQPNQQPPQNMAHMLNPYMAVQNPYKAASDLKTSQSNVIAFSTRQKHEKVQKV